MNSTVNNVIFDGCSSAIYIELFTTGVVIKDTVFRNGYGYGNLISTPSLTTLLLSNCSFVNNTVLYLLNLDNGVNITISDSHFTNNHAFNGTAHFYKSVITFSNTIMENNTGMSVIDFDDCAATFDTCTFSHNKALSNLHGVLSIVRAGSNFPEKEVVFSNCLLVENHSDQGMCFSILPL